MKVNNFKFKWKNWPIPRTIYSGNSTFFYYFPVSWAYLYYERKFKSLAIGNKYKRFGKLQHLYKSDWSVIKFANRWENSKLTRIFASEERTTPGKLWPIFSFEAYPRRQSLLPLSLQVYQMKNRWYNEDARKLKDVRVWLSMICKMALEEEDRERYKRNPRMFEAINSREVVENFAK